MRRHSVWLLLLAFGCGSEVKVETKKRFERGETVTYVAPEGSSQAKIILRGPDLDKKYGGMVVTGTRFAIVADDDFVNHFDYRDIEAIALDGEWTGNTFKVYPKELRASK